MDMLLEKLLERRWKIRIIASNMQIAPAFNPWQVLNLD
jgi:hypothetical protein